MSERQDMSARIVELLAHRGQAGLRRSDIRRSLGLTRHEAAVFRDSFKALRQDGVVSRARGGRYVLTDELGLVTGEISVNARGFGFVSTGVVGADDVFIPPGQLGGALSGDRVTVKVTEPGSEEKGPAGRVTRVVQRANDVVVGCLVDHRGDYAVRPLRRELPDRIPLTFAREGRLGDAEPGDWVRVRLLPPEGRRGVLRAELLSRLGSGSDIGVDLDAVVEEFGLPAAYGEPACAAAAAVVPAEIPRRDCRDAVVVTIDPEDAKDFDDGLSVQAGERPNCVTVGVHIADVACWVQPGSVLDEGARERLFTSYLPGRTLPMLPEPLAGDSCSLCEGVERAAHSVLLQVHRESGEVLSMERVHTRIQVSARLSFDQVNAFLGGDREAVPEAVRSTVSELARLAQAMRRRRAATEGFLSLALPEVRVICSGDPPRVAGLQRVEQGQSEALVEEYMLAANSAVAAALVAAEIPALYRNHPDPQASDLAEFGARAEPLVGRRVHGLTDRQRLNRFLEDASASPLADVILSSFLMALPRAVYGTVCAGHFGLGKAVYCHFTSPIRRYPDLLVHQQLLALDLGTPTLAVDACEGLAARCTAAEERVDLAFRAATDRLKMRYFQDMANRGETGHYEGRVARVHADGLLVYVAELGSFGLLPGGRAGKHRGRVRRSGQTYRCGDCVYVQIQHADRVRGTLEFAPVQARL